MLKTLGTLLYLGNTMFLGHRLFTCVSGTYPVSDPPAFSREGAARLYRWSASNSVCSTLLLPLLHAILRRWVYCIKGLESRVCRCRHPQHSDRTRGQHPKCGHAVVGAIRCQYWRWSGFLL